MEIVAREFERQIYIPENLKGYISGRNPLYFDIETMGLNPQLFQIILIGMSYQKGDKYIVEQFFAESLEEEQLILEKFKSRLGEFDTVVSYNGTNFDVPFINARMEKNNMGCVISQAHLDIICHVRPNKKLLGLESCSLKSVERLLELNREDTIDGEESIRLYKKYIKTGAREIKERILLHNFEDVYNLPGILKVFDVIEFKNSHDAITPRQKSFLQSLLRGKGLVLSVDMDSLSKTQASKLIDSILNNNTSGYGNYIREK